jgi:hypothetical protein
VPHPSQPHREGLIRKANTEGAGGFSPLNKSHQTSPWRRGQHSIGLQPNVHDEVMNCVMPAGERSDQRAKRGHLRPRRKSPKINKPRTSCSHPVLGLQIVIDTPAHFSVLSEFTPSHPPTGAINTNIGIIRVWRERGFKPDLRQSPLIVLNT